MDYQMVVYDATTGVATVQIPTIPKILTGLDKLVQIVVLYFLRNPGKAVLQPVEGSGLRADIGSYNTTIDGAEIRALAIQRTQAGQQEIISRQSANQGTPDERLKSLILRDFAYDESTLMTVLKVQVINEAGDSTNVLV